MSYICPSCGQQVEGRAMKIIMARLTPTQTAIARAMCNRFGKDVSWDSLIHAAWGHDPNGGPLTAYYTIKVHIHYMRKRLEGTGLVIETKQGFGYRLRWNDLAVAA